MFRKLEVHDCLKNHLNKIRDKQMKMSAYIYTLLQNSLTLIHLCRRQVFPFSQNLTPQAVSNTSLINEEEQLQQTCIHYTVHVRAEYWSGVELSPQWTRLSPPPSTIGIYYMIWAGFFLLVTRGKTQMIIEQISLPTMLHPFHYRYCLRRFLNEIANFGTHFRAHFFKQIIFSAVDTKRH